MLFHDDEVVSIKGVIRVVRSSPDTLYRIYGMNQLRDWYLW